MLQRTRTDVVAPGEMPLALRRLQTDVQPSGAVHHHMPLDFESGDRNLYAPAGLDTGSEAPEEIALSIVSEVAAVLSNRRGGSLRERKSDIHAINAVAGGEAA